MICLLFGLGWALLACIVAVVVAAYLYAGRDRDGFEDD